MINLSAVMILSSLISLFLFSSYVLLATIAGVIGWVSCFTIIESTMLFEKIVEKQLEEK